MAEATRTDKFLDAVHDYLPKRAQAWIEDRAFIKGINQDYEAMAKAAKAAKADVDASYKLSPEAQKRYDDQEKYAAVKALEYKAELAEIAYLAEADAMRASGRLSKGDPAIDAAEARADVMGDASIRGRMEFEDPAKSLEGVRQTARDAAGLPSEEQRAAASWRKDAGENYMEELTNKSRENVDYRQSEMWATKQAQNQTAWAVASPVQHEQRQETQANTLTMKP